MTDSHDIWPAGGISDLPADWEALRSRELDYVREIWRQESNGIKGTDLLTVFTEKVAREWAIETGVIENLYELDRGVTQTLIEQGFQSALLEHSSTNKPRDYVLRLLQDQKDALDGLFAFVKQDRTLGTSYIKELHAAMTRNQAGADSVDPQGHRTQVELLRGEWKRWPNSPMKDGVELRYCPPEQTASEMDRLVAMHAEHVGLGVPSEIESAWLHHRFTQIHPFQDGNGRVARALASLVFMRDGLFPLVVTRDEKVQYLDALEAADSGNLGRLVHLFARLQIKRFRRAVNLAYKVRRPAQSVDQALEGFARIAHANGVTAGRVADLRGLLDRYLTELVDKASPAIQRAGDGWGVYLRSSGESDSTRFLEAARLAGGNAYGVLPILPCAWASVKFQVPETRRMVFHVSGIDPRVDGLVQVIGFALDGSTYPPVLSGEPLEWYPAEDESSIVQRLEDWLERAFIQALERVQQSV